MCWFNTKKQIQRKRLKNINLTNALGLRKLWVKKVIQRQENSLRSEEKCDFAIFILLFLLSLKKNDKFAVYPCFIS